MDFKQNAIAALDELKGDSLGIVAATIEDCQKVIGDIPEGAGWIPVTERLPKDDTHVLAIVNGKYENITFADAYELADYNAAEGWVLEIFPEWENPGVTYWMPLPEPPKDG